MLGIILVRAGAYIPRILTRALAKSETVSRNKFYTLCERGQTGYLKSFDAIMRRALN